MAMNFSCSNLTGSERRKQRFFSMLPGFLSWSVLLGFVACSFLNPLWAILFLLVFGLYWLLFLLYTLILYGCAQVSLRRGRDTDWGQKVDALNSQTAALKPDDIYHVVMIPVSAESLENLTRRLDGLSQQDFNKERILVFFALADDAHPKVKTAVWDFHRAHEDQFSSVYISPFSMNTGEKYFTGANLNAAAQMTRHVLERKKISEENTIVSCLDSGADWDPRHLSCLTCSFILCNDRQQRGFRPATVFSVNFWRGAGQAPMWRFGTSLLMVFDRVYPYNLGSFSRQSLSFSCLRKIGYWPDDVLADDMALYWKATLHFKGAYRVLPMNIPNSLDLDHPESVAAGPRKTCSQNTQWAMGIENFPILMRGLQSHSGLSFYRRGWLSGKLLLQQISCTLWAFIFVWLCWLPVIAIACGFYSPVAYYMAPRIFITIGFLSVFNFVVTFILCCVALPKPAERHSFFFWGRQLLSVIFLPILLPVFSCVPLLRVQTRVMFRRIKVEKE